MPLMRNLGQCQCLFPLTRPCIIVTIHSREVNKYKSLHGSSMHRINPILLSWRKASIESPQHWYENNMINNPCLFCESINLE